MNKKELLKDIKRIIGSLLGVVAGGAIFLRFLYKDITVARMMATLTWSSIGVILGGILVILFKVLTSRGEDNNK